jgi:hypothetical protein
LVDGAQVCISYGDRSSEDMLETYGFVQATNKHECVRVWPPPLPEGERGVGCGAATDTCTT